MSKELTANRYGTVGSIDYFRNLNQEYWVGNLVDSDRETAYYDCLRKLADKIRRTVDEIDEDLKKQIGVIRYLPREHRENMMKVLMGLRDLCTMASSGDGRCGNCISMLSLSDGDTRPKSGASDREIEEAAAFVRDSSFLSRSDRMDTVRKAMDWGESSTSGDVQRTLFLRALMNGKSREFLGDVWLRLLYAEDERQFTGRCGRVICSEEYIDHVERHIFGRDIPDYYGGRNGDRAYGEMVKRSLESIRDEIERNLEQGVRDNDYIKDENAQRLKDAFQDLERCGIRCYSLGDKVTEMAWFVGGDPDKIRELQQKLNELGIGERLKEDGVYGKKTLAAWEKFLSRLEHGTVPTLAWIDPLQRGLTGIRVGSSKYGQLHNLNDALMEGTHPYIRIDPKPTGTETAWIHGAKTKIDYPHINIDKVSDSNWIYDQLQNRFNHYELSDDAYNALKDLKSFGKKVRVAGKVLLVAGIALDALELGTTIDGDLKDADRKLGKKTLSTAASIGGSWAGAALGAKLGALAGAATGPAAPIAVPVLGLIGGIGGAFGGDALGKWIVDITCAED